MKKVFCKIFLLTFLSTCITLNSYSVMAEGVSNSTNTELSESGQTIISDNSFPTGDLDGDGQVTSTDYTLIKKHILGQIKHFPVEGKIISQISNFNDVIVNQGDDYKLPISVSVTMQDESEKEIPIIWNVSSVDTSKAGLYTYTATVSGYSNKVNLTLNVIATNIDPTTGANTVSEIRLINLNQFEIVFNTNVDEDTAELTSNYKIGGTDLTESNAHVELVSDNTVRITLVRSQFNLNQGDERTVSVKKGILTQDKTRTIDTYDKEIEFKDVTAPTLKNVSVIGNNKLVIEFSEAVNMSRLSKVAALIEIDGSQLSDYNTTFSKVDGAATNGIETWANKVEFYLNSGLASGQHTIKVKDADNGILVDAIGFSFKEKEEPVTVDNITSKPEIKSITCTADGEISITFDRPMDIKAVLNSNYYQINGKVIYGAVVRLKENNTVLKITNIFEDIFEGTSNTLSINGDVKDAYGNKMGDNTTVSFTKEKDETKPTVLSAARIDNTTLRVKFSENVKYSYTTNIYNYQLINTNNIDLMTKAGVYILPSSVVDQYSMTDTDAYDIKFDRSSYKLDSLKYTLTVRNIIDKASEPNRMDSQTLTVAGKDDTPPSIDDLDIFKKSNTEVAIYFGEGMDLSSITNKANYYYINGNGESINLPESVDIKVSADNKGVVLNFDDANKIIDPSGTSGDDVIKKIGIKTVKDASGNELFVGAMTINACSFTGPRLEENTFRLYKDGNNVKASFQLNAALDTVCTRDFAITSVNNSNIRIIPDSAQASGNTITLTFNEGYAADAVMALGTTATLTISNGSESQDIAGRLIQTGVQQVYYNSITPETDRDNYLATVTIDDTTGEVTSATINITMKTPVDANILGAYRDDFIFTNSTRGTNLYAQSVSLYGNTLTFTISDPIRVMGLGDTIDITAATDPDRIDIRSGEDGDSNHAKFVPTTDDLKVKTIRVMPVN